MQSKQTFRIIQNERELPFLDQYGVKYEVVEKLENGRVWVDIQINSNSDLLKYSIAMNWAGYQEGKNTMKEVYQKDRYIPEGTSLTYHSEYNDEPYAHQNQMEGGL